MKKGVLRWGSVFEDAIPGRCAVCGRPVGGGGEEGVYRRPRKRVVCLWCVGLGAVNPSTGLRTGGFGERTERRTEGE